MKNFTKRDLSRGSVLGHKQADKVLKFVDDYIAYTGHAGRVLHLHSHHYDWLNRALLRGSDQEMNLGTHKYRNFTLVRVPPARK